MPKIDIDKIADDVASGYPRQYRAVLDGRSRKRLGSALGLTQFGVNICTIKPGAQSSQRHWHLNEDEFIYVLEGEVVVVEDDGEIVLKQGEAAGWKAGAPNGHTVINRTQRDARVLEVGTRDPVGDKVVYSDIDMLLERIGNERRYTRKSGEPY
jgi:uncharacterized cupin superfamily protein